MSETLEYGPQAIQRAIADLALSIAARHQNNPHLVLMGIAEGGVPFARKLAQALQPLLRHPIPCGSLNISFHRDDIFRRPITKVLSPTDIPRDIDEATVILADDVFFLGRTARAAMNEIFDHGRPARVELAVLFDRLAHALPIRPDYTGFAQHVPDTHNVKTSLDIEHPHNDLLLIYPP